jgi:NhaP-type Na+/H+ or K+/H+ antiporter
VEEFVSLLALIGIVIIASSLLSGAVERSGIPQVAVFVALGAALGPWGLALFDVSLDSPALRVLATLALVLVLFSDAILVDTRALREQRRLALLVLGPGTLIVAALIGAAGYVLLGLSTAEAAILGAALASTDPVLLRTVLRHKELPDSTRLALRVESGMNDVVLLPIVVIAMSMAGSAGAEESTSLSRTLVGLFILGPLLGALVGWIGIVTLVRVRDRIGVRRDYESLYALGLAFAAFAVAESVGGSGFLAAFAAGLIIAAQDLELCDCFLEYGEASAEMLLLLTFVAFGASLLWTGLTVLDARTVAFAFIALVARTATLYPVLALGALDRRSCRLIAWLGPRGLSSLLLVLLPVFAGMPGAASLFAITSLVVLLSVVLHGSGIAVWLRRDTAERRLRIGDRGSAVESFSREGPSTPLPRVPSGQRSVLNRPTLGRPISIDELRSRLNRGNNLQIIDARSMRTWNQDGLKARGAIRLDPDDAVRSAKERGLDQNGTLVVYCA